MAVAAVTGAVARGADLGIVKDRYFEIRGYGIEAALAHRFPDPEAREAAIRQLAVDRFLEPFMAGLD